jgi:ketosteroid isomerase-like protein
MSQENVEIVRRMLEASDRRDGAAVFAAYDPRIEWDFTDVPEQSDFYARAAALFGLGGVFRGHEAVRSWFREWFSAWEAVDYEHEALIDAGDDVVEFVRCRVRGRESGVEFEFPPYAGVWTLRGGKIVRMKVYWDREEALKAVGLRE